MKVKLVIAGLLLIATPLIATLLIAAPLTAHASSQQAAKVQVTTALARVENWAVSIPAQGEILPWEVANLSAKTEGIAVTEVVVVEGDLVHKGQVLARLDDRLLRAQHAQAKAELALATANHQLAVANLKRFDQLRAKQTVSESDYEVVSNQAAIAAALRDQATAALRSAEIKLADAVVIATDTGKILERNLELGQVPQNGEVMFRLLRQQKLEWVAKIDATELAQVKPALSAEIILHTSSTLASQNIVHGKIRSISPQLGSTSRLATVRVLLDGAPELAVNTYVEGKILVGNTAAIIVPAQCLVVKDGKTWLFRVNNNSAEPFPKAEQVLVQVGRRQRDEIEIMSGINAGDILVQEGAGFLNHGDALAIKTATPKILGAR
jgi:RND family efflux transporter MFP subunit